MPEKFLKETATDKVYSKTELLGYTHIEQWVKALPTLQNNWENFHPSIREYIEKYAAAKYDEKTKQNVTTYNQKLADNTGQTDEQTIDFSERRDSICFGHYHQNA